MQAPEKWTGWAGALQPRPSLFGAAGGMRCRFGGSEGDGMNGFMAHVDGHPRWWGWPSGSYVHNGGTLYAGPFMRVQERCGCGAGGQLGPGHCSRGPCCTCQHLLGPTRGASSLCSDK